MLSGLLGSVNKERVLVYLLARDRAYATEIAGFWESALTPVRHALDKLELSGALVSFPVGRARVYEYNPRYPFRVELQALVARALEFYPADRRASLISNRRRPRRKGKPL